MIKVVCAYCQKKLGEKPSGTGTSHGICAECLVIQNQLLEELKKETPNDANLRQ